MALTQRKLVAGFLVSVAGLLATGCGGSSTKPPATEVTSATVVSPNDRLEKAVKIASLHLKYKEYDNAEKVLQDVLSDPTVNGTAEAIALLEAIKAAKHADVVSAPPAGQSQSIPQPIAALPVVPSAPSTVVTVPVAPSGVGSNPAAPIGQPTAAPSTPVAKTSTPIEKPAEVVVVKDQAAQTAPFVKVPTTDAMIAKLEARLQFENESAVALEIYERFVVRHTLTSKQEKQFTPRLEKWKKLAGQKLVRWGTQWITPESAKQKKAEADELITQALELLKQQNFKEVAKALERASKIDANGIRADFILGLLNSGVAANHPPTADEHFRKVLARSPRHISALNNLALTEIKLGKFPEALIHFTQASEAAPQTPEINQNIGRLVKEATDKKLIVPGSVLPQFSKLYARLTDSGKTQPSDTNVGWLYMPLYLPENERKDRPSEDVSNDSNLVLCGSGSGFVIHPGYVLTNRHVVRNDEFGVADGLKILDPTDEKHKRELTATVVAISADYDIALVKCDAIKSPAIPLSISAPRRGTEILALGYPTPDFIGLGLKATRGIITGLPEEANEGMLLFDAEINGGNSGGPVLDKTGTAVGVATATFNIGVGGKYSGATPIAVAIPFVKTLLPNFANEPASTVEKGWPDIDAQVAPSTVMLLCYYRSVSIGLNQGSKEGGFKGKRKSSDLEDTNCSVCNGSSTRPCPQKGCIKGEVSIQEFFQAEVGLEGIRRKVNQSRYVKSRCPVCRGNARVDCGACSSGRDTSLSGR